MLTVSRLEDILATAEVFTDGDWVESKDQDPDGDVRLIQLADIGVGEFIDKSSRYLTSAKARELRCTFLKEGDILVARMPDPIGRACIFPGGMQKSVTVVDVCIIRPNVSLVDPRWLMHCLNLPDIGASIKRLATGTTRSRISRRNLGKVLIPFPEIAEQRRIAHVLDQVEALRAQRRRAISLLDDLAQSIFLEMFGVGYEIDERWPTKSLGSLLDFLTSGSRGWAKYYTEPPGSLFLRIQNVWRNELDLSDVAYVDPPMTAEANRTRVEPGDVLLSITADLGRTAVVPAGIAEAFINQHLCILRTSQLNADFLSSFLASPVGQERILGKNRQGVKAGLNFNDIKSLRIPCPPLNLQQEFARRLHASRGLRSVERSHLNGLDQLFASLQHRAFRGELWADASPA
jgi:type I restriction enzyme S subunit